MQPPSPHLPRRLGLAVALLAAGVTAYAVAYPQGAVEWQGPFFVPANVGFVLVGGVHGGASDGLVLVASSLVNGAAWGVVAHTAARLLTRLSTRFLTRRT